MVSGWNRVGAFSGSRAAPTGGSRAGGADRGAAGAGGLSMAGRDCPLPRVRRQRAAIGSGRALAWGLLGGLGLDELSVNTGRPVAREDGQTTTRGVSGDGLVSRRGWRMETTREGPGVPRASLFTSIQGPGVLSSRIRAGRSLPHASHGTPPEPFTCDANGWHGQRPDQHQRDKRSCLPRIHTSACPGVPVAGC